MADYSATPFIGRTFGVTIEKLSKSFDGVPVPVSYTHLTLPTTERV